MSGEPALRGVEPKLWAECVRANWQRINDIRQARAEQEVLWNLLRMKAREHQKNKSHEQRRLQRAQH